MNHHEDCDGFRAACLAEAERVDGAGGRVMWQPVCREHGPTSPALFTDERSAVGYAAAAIARGGEHGPAWIDCDGRCASWE